MRTKKLWMVGAFVGVGCAVVMSAKAAELKIGSGRSSPRPVSSPAVQTQMNVRGDRPNAALQSFPVPPRAPVQRVLRGDVGSANTAAVVEKLVYSNTLGTDALVLHGGNGIVADDVTILAAEGCGLMRYKFRVVGRADPNSVGGPYQVDYALYNNCPGAGGPESAAIVGTAGSASFTDDSAVFEVEHIVPAGPVVAMHRTVWLGIKASRPNVGVVAGAPALMGFSRDRLDFPGFPCNANAGGFPGNPHASFYAEVYVDSACAASYPAYTNLQPGAGGFQEGIAWCMADDIQLNVPSCQMTGYDVGLRLATNTPAGAWRLQLHLDNGGLPGTGIPGTERQFPVGTGGGSYVARFTFDPPINSQGNRLWMAVNGNAAGTSWILTRGDAQIGTTLNSYARARSTLSDKRCITMFGNPQFEQVFPTDLTAHGGFDVTIHCQGEAPKGACCDMFLTDDGTCDRDLATCVGGEFDNEECLADIDCKGDPKCRFIPQMNCSFPPKNTGFRPAWVVGQPCKKCQGGSMNNAPCETNANCAGGGTCVTNPAFGASTPCGVAACCPPDDGQCVNRTEKDCEQLDPAYEPNSRQWQLGRYCGQDGQRCPRSACLAREGECTVERPKHCEGGSINGEECEVDLDCRGFCGAAICFGGPFSGQVCGNSGDCQGFTCSAVCVGGPRQGQTCQVDGHCNRDATCEMQPGNIKRCVGGPNADEPCTSSLQCPGGVCSLRKCLDLVPPLGESPKHGLPCEEPRDCREAVCGGEPGCANPICCSSVCQKEFDIYATTFCCNYWWDNVCADLANDIAAGQYEPPPGSNACCKATDCAVTHPNDTCEGDDRSDGAITLSLGQSVEASITTADHSTEEPGYCCHTGVPSHCNNEGAHANQPCDVNEDCWDAACRRLCAGGANEGNLCTGAMSCFFGPNFGQPCTSDANCSGGVCRDDCFDSKAGLCDVPRCLIEGVPPGAACADDAACNTSRICVQQTPQPGAAADGGTVWYRFDIPAGPNPVSVRVNTCNSVNTGAIDSMLQVYTTLNSDAGECDEFGRCSNGDACNVVQQNCADQTACISDEAPSCSLAAQDCEGGTDCVVDLETQCRQLLLLGCNDDAEDGCAAEGHSNRPGNAKLCLGNLEAGRSYYIELGAKTEDAHGAYLLQLTVVSNCGAEGAPNDSCLTAADIEDGATPFDLGAATFECPPPSCAPGSQNDVWFKYVAPANGMATFDTCGGSPQPDTEMAIYQGCDCPLIDNPPAPLACNGFAGGACGDGSRLQLNVLGGQCYLIRIGDRAGVGGSGMLNAHTEITCLDCQGKEGNGICDHCDVSCDNPGCAGVVGCGQSADCNNNVTPDECEFDTGCCPSGPVSFVTPAHEVIDARSPYDAYGPDTLRGISQIVVGAPPGADRFECWMLCETSMVSGSPNAFDSIVPNGDGTYTITFDRPITPSACTQITYLDGDGSRPTASFISHPGNVNGTGAANAQDIDALINYLNGVNQALNGPHGLFSADIDHSTAARASDLEALINALNGAGPLLNPTLNSAIPSCQTCIPTN